MAIDSFYQTAELKSLGFQHVGENVKISRKVSIYAPQQMWIGNNVRIDDFCILSGQITLGNHIHIAAYSALYGGDAGITVGDFANISSRVTIYSKSDDYSGLTLTSPVIPEQYKNVDSRPVVIQPHVIIGTTSVVMPGVTLGEGSAFGAFSYIKNDVPAWSINVGIPCKKIKERRRDLLTLAAQFTAADY